jgi:hypothetical protein
MKKLRENEGGGKWRVQYAWHLELGNRSLMYIFAIRKLMFLLLLQMQNKVTNVGKLVMQVLYEGTTMLLMQRSKT